jgi:DNA invertase Pin-like site-specific DNA recombinase
MKKTLDVGSEVRETRAAVDGSGLRPRRAVLLGRVSRGEKQQDPANQLVPLRAAAQRLGYVVVKEMALKLSAWDGDAAAAVRRQALGPIESGDADTLMVWSWDRYSREGIEGAFRELRHLEDHLGAAFYSLQEPFLSTATADKQQRELLLSIVAWAARWESQRKSDRLKAKVVAKRARSAALGQTAHWGLGKLASDAQVARARYLRLKGATVREIGKQVGISKSQVGRILLSPELMPPR